MNHQLVSDLQIIIEDIIDSSYGEITDDDDREIFAVNIIKELERVGYEIVKRPFPTPEEVS